MIILTSDMASVAAHVYEKHLKSLEYASLLFVGTAAQVELNGDPDNDRWYYDDMQSLKDCGYDVTEYDIVEHLREDTLEQIDAHDILYMSGGSTFYMLQELQKKDLIPAIKGRVESGKTYVGTSTGSIITGPTIEPVRGVVDASLGPDITDADGLNLVSFTVLPHWGSTSFRADYVEYVQHRYDQCDGPLLTLTDLQYVVAQDGSYHIETVQRTLA